MGVRLGAMVNGSAWVECQHSLVRYVTRPGTDRAGFDSSHDTVVSRRVVAISNDDSDSAGLNRGRLA